MRKYCNIQHPTRGRVKFNLFPFQVDTLKQFDEHRFKIILKARQLGISTLVAAYALWKMIFNSDFNVLVVAVNQEVAKNLVTKVKVMYKGLPTWIKNTIKTEEDNKLTLRFSNGSQIKAVAATESAGRSEGLSLLIIDEAAFIEKIEKIWTSAYATLSTGGSAIVLSSPNGIGNWFHKKWVSAIENGDMHPITLDWSVHPERDQEWRNNQTTLLGEKEAGQEHDCDFLSSGYTVIESEILEWYKQSHIEEPIEKRGITKDFWIWEYPDYSKDYIVSCDVSRGDASDYSAFHVIDVESVTQVAEFRSKIDPTELGHMLVEVGTMYNNALVAVENAGVGFSAIQPLLDREYKNLYYSLKEEKYIDYNVHLLSQKDLEDRAKLTPGFTNSPRTRPLIISKMVYYMRQRIPIIRSLRTIEELYVFIWKNGKPIAMDGYSDDLVLSLCINLWVRDTALKLRSLGIEFTKNAMKNISKSVYKSDGLGRPRGWEMKLGKETESLKWLL